jgi:DNA (cytosine-5)-methyltransferase 1
MEPRWVIIENVNRMKKWNRHNELVRAIEAFGYTVSDLHLNSADFGTAQARKRMFLVCDREGSVITKDALLQMTTSRAVVRAASIIDWNTGYPSAKLYRPNRAEATIARAERAMASLGRNVPFIIVYYGSDYAGGWQNVDAPLRTVTTIDRFGLVTWERNEPYLRMLQPTELSKAMGGGTEHLLPYGSRREKVRLCGNGVCSHIITAIFRLIKEIHHQSPAASAKSPSSSPFANTIAQARLIFS